MKGDTRCVDGRLYRHDPQPDDPNLETDRGVCPECNGAGCEPPKALNAEHIDGVTPFVRIQFDKRLTNDELRDFLDYAKEWEQ